MTADKGRRGTALLLCAAMLFTSVCTAIPASGAAPAAADPAAGLCEHHPEHTAECGYAAPTEGSPCQHVHDGTCGYAEPVPGTPCDKGCTDTDGDGTVDHAEGCSYTPPITEFSPCGHIHDSSCGYVPAAAGSPCQYVCEICAAAAGTPAPTPTADPDAPAASPAPEVPETTATPAPSAAPAPAGDAGMEGPGFDEPAADDDIMLTAITEPKVTVTKADGTGEVTLTGQTLSWVHNQSYQLKVEANYSGVTNGRVKITIAPGLKITDYYKETSGSFSAVTPSHTGTAIEGYAPSETANDTLEYTVKGNVGQISLDVTLAVDTVLWPKVRGWTINDAIKIELFDGDGSAADTITAAVTVDPATDEADPAWNKLYVSDPNNSVPAQADKPFRMKTFQVAPNLHGTPLGAFYKELKVTVPYPKLSNKDTYAQYERVDASPQPDVSEDPVAHTVTFTWTNLNIPVGSNFIFTPYFKWGTPQNVNDKVIFSEVAKLQVQATAYGYETPITFANPYETSPTFTVLNDVAINFNGGGGRTAPAEIYNYGSLDQVYQLGQFQVRNDGFGHTGDLTLTFTYPSTELAHVIAQSIPIGGNDETVKSITYKTEGSPETAVHAEIDGKNYRKINNTPSYMLMAPEGEYFTEITAVISGFPAQFLCYNNSAGRSPNNGAVTFGTMAATNTTGEFKASLSITGDNVEGTKDNTYTSNIVQADKKATQMQVQADGCPFTFNGVKTGTVQLGTPEKDRTIHYNAVISATTYPYTNNQVVDRPVIYIRLPVSITVPSNTIELYSVQTGGAVPVEELIDNTHSDHYSIDGPIEGGGDGFHVYKITFADNAGAIGCFNKQLGESQLRLKFDMVADVNTTDRILKMCETVLVGYADGTPIGASGSLGDNQRADTNDLDGDSNRTEYFSTMKDQAVNQLELKAPRIGLEFNSYAKLSTEGDDAYHNYKEPAPDNPEGLVGDGVTMYLTQNEQTIDFRFTAENATGSDLSIASGTLGSEDFYYYIPVPKIGDNWDTHIQDEAFGLDMVLTGPVEITEPDGANGLVEVRYSTSVDSEDKSGTKHYNNADEIGENYKPWDESWDENYKKQIRMIRISVASGTADRSFPDKYKATFTIHYKFLLNAEELVGSAVEFGPCGMTSYKRNGSADTGHTPTQRIRAELQTGRIAGRVFIDEDYSGSYTPGDTRIAFTEGTADPEQKHQAFYDTNGDGDQDEGEDAVEMDIYATGVETPHHAQRPTFDNNPFDNTYAISSLRANTYTLTITNPGYADGAPGKDSLRFIELAKETESSRPLADGSKPLAPASTYAAGYLEKTTASIAVNAGSVTDNRMRDVALQKPHAVTFQVVYDDRHSDTASDKPEPPGSQTIYVWHDETVTGSGATVPIFTLDDDFQWKGEDGPVWTISGGVDTLDASATTITEDVTYTATAVRVPHRIIYNDDHETAGVTGVTGVPESRTAVNGETVDLIIDPTPACSNVDGKTVAFIGWSLKQQPILDRGDAKIELTDESLNRVTQVTMQNVDITVYAVWGYDTDGDGTADVLEDRYTLTYDANGGSAPPAAQTNLLAGETVTLGGQGSMNPPTKDKKVIFAGWTGSDHLEVVRNQIFGKDDAVRKAAIDGYLLPSTVTMGEEDMTVYAVWAYDENDNNMPDYQEHLYSLTYHYSGNKDQVHAENPGSLTEVSQHLPGTKVTLWPLPEGTTWRGTASDSTGVVFVGWSSSEPDQVYETAPGDSILVTSIEGINKDEIVYAVWAYDRNSNDKPDYLDEPITLHYDLNGGTGATISDRTVVAGATYPLASGSGLTRNYTGQTYPAVFVGWSLTRPENAIPETVTEEEFNAYGIIEGSYKIPDDAAGSIILYAVYAEDNNGDHVADYTEDAHQVAYYPNGGQDPVTGEALPNNEPFYTCPHHHVAHENAGLLGVNEVAGRIKREGAVLVGWSKEEHAGVFGGTAADKAEAEKILIDTVEIPDDGDAERNAKVYAVWAEDKNGNGRADYGETRYCQWYYYNSALIDWSPSSSDPALNTFTAPSATDAMPANVVRIEYGVKELPAAVEGILTGRVIFGAPLAKSLDKIVCFGMFANRKNTSQ